MPTRPRNASTPPWGPASPPAPPGSRPPGNDPMNRLTVRAVPLAAGLVATALAPAALAHPGPRVWLNVQGQAVTTYAGPYPPGDPANYARSRVFTQALTEDGGSWYTDFP